MNVSKIMHCLENSHKANIHNISSFRLYYKFNRKLGGLILGVNSYLYSYSYYISYYILRS